MYMYSILKSEFNNYDLNVNDVRVKIEQTHDKHATSPGEIRESTGLYYMYTFEEHTPAYFISKLTDYFDKIVDKYTDLSSRARNLLIVENNKLLQTNENADLKVPITNCSLLDLEKTLIDGFKESEDVER